MSTLNSYVTLDQFKQYITASGQTIGTDTTDDAVLDIILDGASRYIDGETGGRTFYPRVETRYFSVPENTDGELLLDDDLLAVTTLTNGSSTDISSTDYNLLPRNMYPKYAVRLTPVSSVFWEWSSDGNDEYVISLLGTWGYHNQYASNAWILATTISEDLTAGETSVDVTSASALQVGMIIKVDSELQLITGIATNTLTVTCGHNGSTAAVHTSGASVYYWRPQADIYMACMEIAVNAKARRFGQNVTGASTVTPGGIVIGPHDIPETAAKTIERYRRLC